ncbi:isoleucyl-tRNA synthetase [Candidatus Karelsulcia muelleri CARI]|uniref:Isoleucine--tRNA ligase n=1 Tax=Karelsulcia muelleri (strain CARI) TaxID=706194 RepID=E0TJ79_KARMC|nr:isoleucyl-tRNA synthetase [Candidatus Karelsulcia muelleri CARI]
MFKEYKNLEIDKITNEIRCFWEQNKIFEKSIIYRNNKKLYVFYEGPPSANGSPGIHHILSRTIKDIFCRYNTLKGKKVTRKAGWDTHGLPVELVVETKLGITKNDIGKKISIYTFNKKCKEAVMRYSNEWKKLSKHLGYWIYLDKPYYTFKTKYIETIWWLLKNIYKKKFLYKGYKIQPYSPAAGTGLSSHELNIPGAYKKISDLTIIVQFKSKKKTLPKKLKKINGDIYLLSWTTTPWTLPSNTALTVGRNIDYVVISTYNPYSFSKINIILAKKLIKKVLSKNFLPVRNEKELKEIKQNKIPYLVLNVFKGETLIGSCYEQLIDWFLPYKNKEKAFKIISGNIVNQKIGTGIVHISPTFGEEDFFLSKKHGIPPMLILDKNKIPRPLVDMEGKFIKETPYGFSGKYVKNEYYSDDKRPDKSVDLEIALFLKKRNKVFKIEKYIHSYPHCWRTQKPILYYPLDSWFIKTTSLKKEMLYLNQFINWKPKSTGKKKFGYWLENLTDWNLSRSRFWGIPLPIWRTKKGDEEIVIGSIEELINEIDKSVKEGFMSYNPFKNFIIGNMSEKNYDSIDLHKHNLDNIILLSKYKKPMIRESDIIDVWFDSGAMPYAQLHYPFENQFLIDKKKFFPADFICEGVDQTRGWFFTLHTISCILFNSISFKNVISNGLVLDKKGKKMSKSRGNTINPFEIIKKYGPDTIRWYFISNSSPWGNIKFNIEKIENIKKKFFGTLYNVYSFFAIYANIDNFKYKEKEIKLKNRPTIDKWILSELNTLIKKTDNYYNNYEPTKVARKIEVFVIDNLSNWYIRLSRRRFWKGNYTNNKISAYQTLYTCLLTIYKISSPIAPFFMENFYKNLNKTLEPFESVHLSYYPKYNISTIDQNLELKMSIAKNITSMIFSLRKKEKIKVRQPLKIALILINNFTPKKNFIINIIKKEVNIKHIKFLSNKKMYNFTKKKIKINYKLLGPKFGKNINLINSLISKLNKKEIKNIENGYYFIIKIHDHKICLSKKDVYILTEYMQGWSAICYNGITVALDTNISEDLKKEGLSRELINKIQNIRKYYKYKITDKILLYIETSNFLEKIIKNNKKHICEETLTSELILIKNLKYGIFLYIENNQFKIFLKRNL